MQYIRGVGRVSRREFLASAAAVPFLGSICARPTFAEERRQSPPYLALEKFIQPGADDFEGELEAARIVESLDMALRSGALPASTRGMSPCPSSYRSTAADVGIAVFDKSDTGVSKGWTRWVASLGKVRRARFSPLPDGIVRYEITSERDGKIAHRVGRWKQRWDKGALVEFMPVEEEVAFGAAPFFRDVSATVFNGASSYREQMLGGIPYWRSRLDPACGIDVYGNHGIAAADIDGDGVDEIYVCQPGGLPNRLYKFGQDGSATDITDAWGVGMLDETPMAVFLDLRNTGEQDLVVLRGAGPVLFLNDGNQFRLLPDAFRFATPPAGTFTGMAAADFDRDGKLDLYLCCYMYFQSEAQYNYPAPYHDAQNGPPNFLFRNKLQADGNGFFEDCTAETGINENNDRFSFAASWCDFNGDGWPDLYVANDFGLKNLYVNNQGRFRDLAKNAGVEDIGDRKSVV